MLAQNDYVVEQVRLARHLIPRQHRRRRNHRQTPLPLCDHATLVLSFFHLLPIRAFVPIDTLRDKPQPKCRCQALLRRRGPSAFFPELSGTYKMSFDFIAISSALCFSICFDVDRDLVSLPRRRIRAHDHGII